MPTLRSRRPSGDGTRVGGSLAGDLRTPLDAADLPVLRPGVAGNDGPAGPGRLCERQALHHEHRVVEVLRRDPDLAQHRHHLRAVMDLVEQNLPAHPACRQAPPLGRRQVGAFHMPGDIFGFETGDEHTFSDEAITDCKIIVIKRSAVMALAARDNDVARQMWELTARELQRVQKHSLALIKTAEERVAGFLLEMADRVASGGTVELPMSRQDIAAYLGLTIETVSRSLKLLEDAAAIEVARRRRILLRNRPALRRLNG